MWKTTTTKILDVLGCIDEEICIVFVSDRKMRELNRQFRNIDKTTDVLSFPARETDAPNPEEQFLGDVVVSIEAAQRQAEEYGESLDEEITRLLTHGVLHCLGYDHQTKTDEKRMMTKQNAVLKKLAKGEPKS